MIAALARHWIESCRERGVRVPQRVHVLKLGTIPYPHPASPLVFLLFADRAREPGAAAKAARMSAGDAAVRVEAGWLSDARERLPAAVAAAIPQCLASGDLDGRAFFLSTPVDGRVELHHTWGARAARRAAKRIASALEWVDALARASPAAAIAASEWLGPLAAARATLETWGLAPATSAWLEARLPAMWEARWPAAVAHGDFFPGNVLFGAASRLGVVDWSAAALRAPVCVDPLAYEMSFALHALHARGAIDAAEHRAVHELAPFTAARRRLAEAGIDTRLGSDARVLTCVAGVLREAGAAVDRADAARRWLRLLEFEAGVAATLKK